MIIRCALITSPTAPGNPLAVDLPTYQMLADDATVRRAFVDVPSADVPSDVAAFVAAYPTVDLVTPLPVPFPLSLASSWAEFLARRYDLGSAKWHPVVA
jgi:hypothetical protein